MAKLSVLVRITADVLGLPEGNVREIARRIRQAGHITIGGRGAYAPEMTARDATALLLALLGGYQVRGAPKTVAMCGALVCRSLGYLSKEGYGDIDLGEALGLNVGDNLSGAIATLIDSWHDGFWRLPRDWRKKPRYYMPYELYLKITRPFLEATITVTADYKPVWQAIYVDPITIPTEGEDPREALDDILSLRAEYGERDLTIQRSVTGVTFLYLHAALRGAESTFSTPKLRALLAKGTK